MWFAGLVLGLLVGWLFLPTPIAICGVWSSQAMPAWVQAIGSIVAILVAAGIPWWQERIKRREARLQLSIATLRLRSQLEMLGAAALDRSLKLRALNVWDSPLRNVVNNLTVFESRPVLEHVENVHHFEPRIQEPILRLCEQLDQFDMEQGRLHNCADADIYDEFNKAHSGLITMLQSISTAAFAAATAIRLVDEEKKYPDLRAQNLGNRA